MPPVPMGTEMVTIDVAQRRMRLGASAALTLGVGIGALSSRSAEWHEVELLVTLLVLAIGCDFLEVTTKSLRLSGSFLALVLAMTLLGPTSAAVLSVMATAVTLWRRRASRDVIVVELAIHTAYPLAGGWFARLVTERGAIDHASPNFLLVVIAVFLLSNLLNFTLVASFWAWSDRISVARRFRQDYLPVFPWELVTALLAAGVAGLYEQVGLPALALAAVVILIFQYLLRELLTSQRRAELLEERTKQLAGLQVGVLAAMLQTLGLRDSMTARHSAAVARYTRELAQAADRSPREQELVHTAALLHDIGKFALPDAILLAQRPLTSDDWTLIRRHPEEGARVLRRVDGYGPVADIVLCHHEKVDGSGYPQGLKSDEIPLFARMIAVTDAYDVMTARDSYRVPMTSSEATEELRRSAGSHFDPWIVETFINVLARRGVEFRHGDDADFEAELAFEHRIRGFVPLSA